MNATGRMFDTDRRIRLGIWGLGRGLHLAGVCEGLNMDVVAGLDYSDYMRRQFSEQFPGAYVTDDVSSFLASDCDAVLLASYFPNHANDATACLQAGKHVLSEVTAFMTMADGVRLVDEVERTGLVYNMAENYPFTPENRWLARRWKEGIFGELMYGEYEYVHEVLSLAFTDINGVPLEPGSRVHAWRSWLHLHYYNTHSLGVVMEVTGTRPVEVCSLPGSVRLPGYLIRAARGMGGVAPSLLRMSNGGLVRNLMGATTNDSHIQRLWGTRGSAEQVDGKLRVRLGGFGNAPKHEVTPRLDALGERAASTGHGGGDYWALYYFAKHILDGTPAPFDIYTSADCVIAGIQAYRSQHFGGTPQPIPDFRVRRERELWRNDDLRQPAYDTTEGVFGGSMNDPVALSFTTVMRDLIAATNAVCAYKAWQSIAQDVDDPEFLNRLEAEAAAALPKLEEARAAARKIMDAYPQTDGARVLSEVLSRVDVL